MLPQGGVKTRTYAGQEYYKHVVALSILMHFMHVLYHGIAALWVTRLFKWADASCLSMHGNGAVLRYH